VDPVNAEKYRKLAEEHGRNIRESLTERLIESPVVPIGNGCWIPSSPIWTEDPGALMLHAEGGDWYSHGTFMAREATGSQYLYLHGLLDCRSEEAGFTENFFAEHLCSRNVLFSQPYYSPHPYINLMRGHVKAFLSEFYNNFSGLADRETYSFWEHYFHASPHKLHEETWFLMRCRWMLWLEDGNDLRLLAGIPRAWMEDGKKISYSGVKSYFGTVSLEAESHVAEGKVAVKVRFESNGSKMPERILVRLPHPDETVRAKSTTLGSYCSECESVILSCRDQEVNEFEFELLF